VNLSLRILSRKVTSVGHWVRPYTGLAPLHFGCVRYITTIHTEKPTQSSSTHTYNLPSYKSPTHTHPHQISFYPRNSRQSKRIMSLPVSYFPSVRPSAIVLGTVFEHVSSFIVYGPLFGQTWQKAMNADKVSCRFRNKKVDICIRTRNSGRVRKPKTLLPSMVLLLSPLVFR
jgi:hypothetical protein